MFHAQHILKKAGRGNQEEKKEEGLRGEVSNIYCTNTIFFKYIQQEE